MESGLSSINTHHTGGFYRDRPAIYRSNIPLMKGNEGKSAPPLKLTRN